MISFAVVAHEQRLIAATELAHQLGAVITVDDGTAGPDSNHLEAWQLTDGVDAPWSCVVEDDAIPVLGFVDQAEQALAAAPAPIVSFYLGTGKPKSWQLRIARALSEADDAGAHWLTTCHLLHAVAVAVRTDLRQDWLDWAPSSTLPIDQRLSEWARLRGHPIAYTLPSLVDHLDGPTLIQHSDRQPRTMPRVAWRTGTRSTWTRQTVTI